MRMIRQLFLVLALVGPSLATAHDELGREPRGPNSSDPEPNRRRRWGTVTAATTFPGGRDQMKSKSRKAIAQEVLNSATIPNGARRRREKLGNP